MPQEYRTLAQITPAPNTITNLVVTSATSQAVVGTITVSGLDETVNSSFSIIVRPINEALDSKHYIFRGSLVIPDEILVVSGAVTLGPDTILAARSTTGNAHFTVYGVELT